MTATAPLDVLIVDDSAAIRKILQRVLRQTDLNLGEIKEAGDGTEAVEILKDRTFGLDPVRYQYAPDGRPATARPNQGDGPPEECSRHHDHDRRRAGKGMEAVQLGATGYVRKPFTADQIKEKLAGVIC